jgi:Arc/MetJ family transcription regulator
MEITAALDEDLLAEARAITGVEDVSELLSDALKALIEREAARRLARLGGSDPNACGSASTLRRLGSPRLRLFSAAPARFGFRYVAFQSRVLA